MIELKDVSFSYEEKAIFSSFSCQACDGECTCIVGHNGAGKTTILKLMSGVLRPEAGEILLDGRPLWEKRGLGKAKVVKDHASLIGYVMQKPERQLFADTVEQDIAFGPKNIGMSDAEIKSNVDKWIKYFGIEAIRESSPFKISGGQQRMTALAGILAMNTKNILLDEPSSSLDAEAVEKIHTLIKDLKAEGRAVVLVSHDLAEIELLADKVIEL